MGSHRSPRCSQSGRRLRTRVAVGAIVLGCIVAFAGCNLRLPLETQGYRGNGSVPDTTSAIGTTRFVEVSNDNFTIWDRAGSQLFSGLPSQVYGDYAVDPQVVWDAKTQRFFFGALQAFGPSHGLRWGFSRTDSPNGPADWCNYFDSFDYGSAYPDYPRLGTTADFVLVGANRLTALTHVAYGTQSDVMWFSKPPAGNACPPASSFRRGIVDDLRNADHTEAFTPLPARQVDGDPAGWVLATHTFAGDTISAFSVTRSAVGDAILGGPRTLPIPHFSVPNVASESGTGADGQPAPPVETLDARLTQAIAAFDPRFGHIDIWTAHSVQGGAGSEVRWYEIDPVGTRLDQSGVVSDPNRFVFNATISPDRAVNGSSARFGSSMIVEANASSSTTPISIVVVSKHGPAPQTGLLTVKSSLAGDQSVRVCTIEVRRACVWGDFSGSSPDPLGSSDGTNGQVWGTNTWVDSNHIPFSWNFSVVAAAPPTPTTQSGDVDADRVECTHDCDRRGPGQDFEVHMPHVR